VQVSRAKVEGSRPFRMAGAVGIGEQLRTHCTAAEPIPERLVTLLQRFEAGDRYPEPPAIRLAIIHAAIGGVLNARSENSVRASPPSGWVESARHYHNRARLPSRRATALGRFEKLVLDLLDLHLSEAERDVAIRTFSAYVRSFHALLDLGLIRERELDAQELGFKECSDPSAGGHGSEQGNSREVIAVVEGGPLQQP
jgi:hypothetical protein